MLAFLILLADPRLHILVRTTRSERGHGLTL
jgi:hypothetical protein